MTNRGVISGFAVALHETSISFSGALKYCIYLWFLRMTDYLTISAFEKVLYFLKLKTAKDIEIFKPDILVKEK